MKKETAEYVKEKTKELMAAPSCCQGAKDAAQSWLDAVGTAKEAEETKKYIAELEADIGDIDHVIAIASSDMAIEKLGKERAAQMAAHAKERKAAGAKYCDCPACTAVAAILEKKDDMLA